MVKITKKCWCCKKTKLVSEFHKRSASKDGLQNRCKTCSLKLQHIYRRENLDRIRLRDRVKHRELRKENPEKTRREGRARYAANPGKYREQARIRYSRNPEERRSKQREWTKRNKWYVLKYSRIRREKIEYRIEEGLRRRVNSALRGKGKSISTIKLIGCSIEEYKRYLENLWEAGMNWENWGLYGWHIDHIIPCSSFNLSNPGQQLKCFNFKNTQPLWAEENLSKGTKIIRRKNDRRN